MTARTASPMRIVVLCTVAGGVDVVLELAQRGLAPAALVGLHPDNADPDQVSGWIDVHPIGARLGIETLYARSYGLKSEADRTALTALEPDLILVTGWQRLIPKWLIELPQFGALGGHGSADGVHGGRGRSPQNWALLLGCRTFDYALFRITPGIDDGPILARRTFSYGPADDIQVSHFRASLAMADMIEEVLRHPERLKQGEPQPLEAFYYPQRMPGDGWADWNLPMVEVERHCRALTRPYPGLRAQADGTQIRIWDCLPFDDDVAQEPGTIGSCFAAGEFLVHALDGRLLVRAWSAEGNWYPRPRARLTGRPWQTQLTDIVTRHQQKYPDLPITSRILRRLQTDQ